MIVGLDVACRSDAIPAAPRAEICWSICVSVCILARRFNTAFEFFCAEHGSPCSFMLRHRSCLRAPGQSSICVWGGETRSRDTLFIQLGPFILLRGRIHFLAAGVHLFVRPPATTLTGFANNIRKNIKTRYCRIGLRRFWAPIHYACEKRTLNDLAEPRSAARKTRNRMKRGAEGIGRENWLERKVKCLVA